MSRRVQALLQFPLVRQPLPVRTATHNTPWWAGHARGYGLINGLITAEELNCGAIEHALVVAYPYIRSRYYTSPASTAQGFVTCSRLPEMVSRPPVTVAFFDWYHSSSLFRTKPVS